MKQILKILSLLLGIMAGASLSLRAVNKDGKSDIYWRNNSTGDNAAWLMNGTNYSSSATLGYYSNLGWKIAGTGDFNSDGELDLLWRNSTNGLNAVWYQCGSDFMSGVFIQPLNDTNWTIVATGYFGGVTDQNIDILWRNYSTGDNAIWHLNGTTIVSTELIQEVVDLNWKIVGAGDFNNDTHYDIVWRHATNGLNQVWYMQGGTFLTAASLQTEADLNWEIAGAGYFSGTNDTTVDLLWRSKTTGDNAIWQLNGLSLTNSQVISWAATNWMVGGVGDAKIDIDADGLPDVWERRFFGNLSATGSADPDGDSQSNSTECQNGTDPTTSNTAQNIGNAVESNLLTWTSSGNAAWAYSTASSYTNGNSAKSGSIGNNQQSSLTTRVLGPGTFKFHWRISSETNHDYLEISRYNDNGEAYLVGSTWTYSGTTSFQQQTINLNPGTNRITFRYSKDASGVSGDDAAYVDNVQYSFWGDNSTTTNSLAAAVDDINGAYSTSDYPWVVLASTNALGGYMARSAYSLPDGAGSVLSTTVNGPGWLYFSWAVSSHEGNDEELWGDWLDLWVDWQPVEEDFGISGGSGTLEERVVSIGSGSHTLYWSYSKDSSDAAGQDCGYIDHIRFVPDLDSDGLADNWEVQYFGSTGLQNGFDDFDADGLTNLQEYQGRTNPGKAELSVRVASPRRSSLLP
jgi:hypothetical protein